MRFMVSSQFLFQMFVQDMITFVPTMAVMSLFAFYREEVMCLWGCNPFMNGIASSVKNNFQVASTYAQIYMRIIMTHATNWYSSASDVSKHALSQWAQHVVTGLHEMSGATLALYLYIIYTFAFAMILYAGIIADARSEVEEEEREERMAMNKKKRVYIAPIPRRPITRSMTQERLTQNVY